MTVTSNFERAGLWACRNDWTLRSVRSWRSSTSTYSIVGLGATDSLSSEATSRVVRNHIVDCLMDISNHGGVEPTVLKHQSTHEDTAVIQSFNSEWGRWFVNHRWLITLHHPISQRNSPTPHKWPHSRLFFYLTTRTGRKWCFTWTCAPLCIVTYFSITHIIITDYYQLIIKFRKLCKLVGPSTFQRCNLGLNSVLF
jgi:hypothetical protein